MLLDQSVRPLQTTGQSGACFQPGLSRNSGVKSEVGASKLEESLEGGGSYPEERLEDLKSIGLGDPAQLIIAFHAECLP